MQFATEGNLYAGCWSNDFNLVGLGEKLYHVNNGTSLARGGFEKSQGVAASKGRWRRMDQKGVMTGVEFKGCTAVALGSISAKSNAKLLFGRFWIRE